MLPFSAGHRCTDAPTPPRPLTPCHGLPSPVRVEAVLPLHRVVRDTHHGIRAWCRQQEITDVKLTDRKNGGRPFFRTVSRNSPWKGPTRTPS